MCLRRYEYVGGGATARSVSQSGFLVIPSSSSKSFTVTTPPAIHMYIHR